MKKNLLCLVAITGALVTHAQVFFTDSFTNSSLPGWTIVNEYAAGGSTVLWKWDDNPSSLGGAAGTFNYSGASNGHIIVDSDNDADQSGATNEYTTITSNAISCTGKSTVFLSFYEYYTKYLADTVGVYISNDSTTWHLVFDPGANFNQDQATANPDFVETNITQWAANQATVYIRFSWKGNWDYWWFVDDVTLSVPDLVDAQALELKNELSNGCNLTNAEAIRLKFRNHGINPIDSFMALYSVNGGTPVSEMVHLVTPLLLDSTYTYDFTTVADFSAANVYGIAAWVQLAGELNTANDTAFNFAVSADPINLTTPYTMGFEVPNIGNEIGGFTWTTEDANADGYSWFFSTTSPHGGGVNYRYSYNLDASTGGDDWLYSPCLSMDNSKAYRISFWDKTGYDANGIYPEGLELKAGTTKGAGNLLETVADLGTFADTAYVKRVLGFKPQSTGIYYIGFHVYSDPDQWYINIDDVQIDLLPLPVAKFGASVTGNNLTVADSSADAITEWTWNWGDGTTPGSAADPGVHTYSAPGTYTVCLKVTNLAGSDSVCHSVTVLPNGITTVEPAAQMSIYPNPTNRLLNVNLSGNMKGNAQVEIVNVLGETMLSRETAGNTTVKFDLADLAQGVYFVRLTGDGIKTIRKFVYAK